MSLLKSALFSVIALSFSSVFAQELLYEVAIQEQIDNADVVVEGKVVSRASYWNSQQTNIFTVNTVEVYKIFKGYAPSQVEIITPGGTVGLTAEMVIPSLELLPNDEGVFMLQTANLNLQRSETNTPAYIAFSDTQGFYKYNYSNNSAVNPFNQIYGIDENFYQNIIQYTHTTPVKITDFDVNEQLDGSVQNRGINNVSSISPSVSTAGTGSILVINGTGFAPAGLTGTVSFPDANDGGATYFEILESQVISWTDTQIQVEIPSRAGTGQVRINTFVGPVFTPVLTIDYAQLNVISDFTGVPTAYQTQHVDENFIGGMTWQMNNNFNNNVPARESFIRSFDTWVCETGINWVLGSSTAVNVAEFDNINIVRFDVGAELPAGVLGRTSSYWNGCAQGSDVNWFVAELDIVYNDGINWNFGPGAPTGGQIDFESVSVHELGHAHQLGHVIDNTKIMFWSAGPGSANRILSQEDIDGASDVQSRSTGNPVCGLGVMTGSDCFLSVSDAQLDENIKLFPNPASQNITLQIRGNIVLSNVNIYDLSGKLLFRKSFSGNYQSNLNLDIDTLSTGVYFVELNSETATAVKKLIVK
jgi:hypothetical protein